MMMMSSPFLSSNNNINCSPAALVFQYDSPMFFTVKRSTKRHYNNKRKHSSFAVEQHSEDLATSVSKRARSVPVRCKRTFTDLNKDKSYRNKEEEVVEEEPAVHSPSKQRRTTLLSKRRVFVYLYTIFNEKLLSESNNRLS